MSRLWQIFQAPGPDDVSLPLDESPWHVGRQARLPKEHWDAIVALARRLQGSWGELLERASDLDDDASRWTTQDSTALLAALGRIIEALPAVAPLTPQVTPDIPENYGNDEHARMVAAVAAVVRESLADGAVFTSYTD
jgi:hypothetical protein